MSSINILAVTTLYPNKIQFRHGVFVETRLKKLSEKESIKLTVIAPVPWFPFKTKLFSQYSKLIDVPFYENRHGISVYHPRYIVVPKIGMIFTPFFLAFSIYCQVKRLMKQGEQYDVIDAHYYYPDGVSAAIVSRLLKLPLTITARGTDINLIPDFNLPRKMILWASGVAKYNLAVCNALRLRMIEIGINAANTKVFRNGVDLSLFKPMEKQQLRQKWQIKNKLLLSVGFLIERKGHHLVIEALLDLPDYDLFIVGGGDWESKLKELAIHLGVESRVRFLGELEQNQLSELYNCADALVLASSREGWANVLLEAMACGTPVVATNIWGTPEVVQIPEAGVLCQERSSQGIVEGVTRLFNAYPDRHKTRAYAEKFSWDDTTNGLESLFSQIKEDAI